MSKGTKNVGKERRKPVTGTPFTECTGIYCIVHTTFNGYLVLARVSGEGGSHLKAEAGLNDPPTYVIIGDVSSSWFVCL